MYNFVEADLFRCLQCSGGFSVTDEIWSDHFTQSHPEMLLVRHTSDLNNMHNLIKRVIQIYESKTFPPNITL